MMLRDGAEHPRRQFRWNCRPNHCDPRPAGPDRCRFGKLYGVTTKRLNQQVRRNRNRFPAGFIFHVRIKELRDSWLQIATSSKKFRGPKRESLVFTEHGAIMIATVLNSPRAVQMSIYVVRAFVKLRQVLESNAELARKLQELEQSIANLDARTRKQFEELYAAIRALMAPAPEKSRPIGFTAHIAKED